MRGAILLNMQQERGNAILNKLLKKIEKSKSVTLWEELINAESEIIGYIRPEILQLWITKMKTMAPQYKERMMKEEARAYEQH